VRAELLRACTELQQQHEQLAAQEQARPGCASASS
jgi:hypothetical protein